MNKDVMRPTGATPNRVMARSRATKTCTLDGAYFKGSIEIEKSAEEEGDKNVFSPTASAPATPAGPKPKSI